MGIAINDLVTLLGKVIHVELKSESEDLFIGSFKVLEVSKVGIDFIISGYDEEGLNRSFPIKWVSDYHLMN